MSEFSTIKKQAEGLYKEKGSRFISYLLPINGIEQVDHLVAEYRLRFADATHVCYAYKWNNFQHGTDAGEPAHTAGAPILRRILAHKLNAVLLFVIRYYGGSKLGVAGLINAYESAAENAIQNAEIILYKEIETLCFSFSYDQTNEINRILREVSAEILKETFTEACEFQVSVEKNKAKTLVELLARLKIIAL